MAWPWRRSSLARCCGYEMLRSSANTLFVQEYGKQALPWRWSDARRVTLLTFIYGGFVVAGTAAHATNHDGAGDLDDGRKLGRDSAGT